jgi:hypothetical protein
VERLTEVETDVRFLEQRVVLPKNGACHKHIYEVSVFHFIFDFVTSVN